LAPWALQALAIMNFTELDASFKALKPFAYSIPTVIYHNKSIPIGLFLCDGEKRELFSNFIEMLLSLGVPIDFLQAKGFLTDEGTGLKSALKQFNLTRHSCFRHLIEKMGSNSVMGTITRRLLFCSTQAAYASKMYEAIFEVRQLFEKDEIKENQVKTFCKIFDLELDNDEFIVLTQLDHHNALWLRANQGIATCSNHLERLHRTLNQAVSPIRLFSRRLHTVFTILLEWPTKFSVRQHRQEKEVLNQLKENVAKFSIQQSEECHNLFCGWSFFYSNLFGVGNFPCVHTLNFKVPLFTEIDFPPFFDAPNFIEMHETQHTNETVASQKEPVPNKKNQLDLLYTYSGSVFDFLMETAEEMILLNPKQFKNKYHALCIVTNRWTIFTQGLEEEPYLICEEDIDETNQLDLEKAEFRIELFTDPLIIGVT
jgi:hypothetical protein